MAKPNERIEQDLKNMKAFVFPTKIRLGDAEFQGSGLTKRELFAGLAMVGLLANSFEDVHQEEDVRPPFLAGSDIIAEDAVMHADALIRELEKGAKQNG